FLFHDHFADKGRRRNTFYVDRQRIIRFHAERSGVDDDIVSGRIGRAGDDFQIRIMSLETLRQTVHGLREGIVEAEPGGAGPGERRGDRRTDAAEPATKALAPLTVRPLPARPRTKPSPS